MIELSNPEGLFAQEGLHVTIKSIVSSADATAGQNDGKYDITAGNSVSYMQDQVRPTRSASRPTMLGSL